MKEEIKKLTQEVVEGHQSEEEKIQALWDFIKEEIKYKVTIIADPLEILERGYGSCIDKTILFVTMARSIGIRSRYHAILINLKPVIKRLVEKSPTQIKKLSIDGMLLEEINKLDKIPNLPHTYPEGYSGKEWIKLVGPSLDSELQSQFKEGLLPSGPHREDIGTFETFSEVIEYPEIKTARKAFLEHSRLTSLIINKINGLLLSFRKNKEKGLVQKEDVREIISRAEKFARKEK